MACSLPWQPSLHGMPLRAPTPAALPGAPLASGFGFAPGPKRRSAVTGPSSEQGRVWINATQSFAGVPEEVWAFEVGGDQVCAQWLKDRKGRVLTFQDIVPYQPIVAALAETI
ncbi:MULTISPECIES: type ISP restriction/modification enzyme [Thermogemmatispora]|uniref:type ISP restriction/modification enzyme n=1 Tax=Thermogemmatispora TaxID=768669 RepID=UPI00124D0626|nr:MULTISPECIES: type ISP restriction/modification enzyme [Thermogemmatispora]